MSVFGWQADIKPYMPYTEWLSCGKPIAGMMPMPPDIPIGRFALVEHDQNAVFGVMTPDR